MKKSICFTLFFLLISYLPVHLQAQTAVDEYNSSKDYIFKNQIKTIYYYQIINGAEILENKYEYDESGFIQSRTHYYEGDAREEVFKYIGGLIVEVIVNHSDPNQSAPSSTYIYKDGLLSEERISFMGEELLFVKYYFYNSSGKLGKISEENKIITFKYNKNGKLKEKREVDNEGLFDYDELYEYDSENQMARILFIYNYEDSETGKKKTVNGEGRYYYSNDKTYVKYIYQDIDKSVKTVKKIFEWIYNDKSLLITKIESGFNNEMLKTKRVFDFVYDEKDLNVYQKITIYEDENLTEKYEYVYKYEFY